MIRSLARLGRTEAAKAAKAGGRRPTRQWDELSLLDDIDGHAGPTARATAHELLRWTERHDDVTVTYSTGAKLGTAQVKLQADRKVILTAFFINSDGSITIPFLYMKSQPFGESRESRDELRGRITEAVPRAAIPPEDVRENPTLPLDAMDDAPARQAFIAAFEWAFVQAREAQPRPPAL